MQSHRPVLVVVSGPAGSGKTTLAHELARALRCPAICRDEIKEGLVRGRGSHDESIDPDLVTYEAFFEVVRVLLAAGVATVAEAAFQHHHWAPGLVPLGSLASIRVVQCRTDPAVARERFVTRAPARAAHADDALLPRIDDGRYYAEFERVAIAAPSIAVDTTAGYEPALEDLVAFIEAPHAPR